MKLVSLKFLITVALSLALLVVIAQPTGGGPGGGGDPDAVPIDGFLGILMAAGALFGYKKLRQNKTK